MKPTLPPEWAATAAEWRRERDASAVAKPNGKPLPKVDEARPPAFSDETPLPPLEIVNAQSLAGKEPRAREWLIQGLIPAREITMLSGDGGTGKSLLALQLAVAVATATDWAGQVPNKGRSLFISAEDDVTELHRRLSTIIRAQRVVIEDLGSLNILPLAGRDAVLAAPKSREGLLSERASAQRV
jgi:Mrp family chromosome partitioning ATPase